MSQMENWQRLETLRKGHEMSGATKRRIIIVVIVVALIVTVAVCWKGRAPCSPGSTVAPSS